MTQIKQMKTKTNEMTSDVRGAGVTDVAIRGVMDIVQSSTIAMKE
jgi:actin-like ATPase involved in cell morphogenesis